MKRLVTDGHFLKYEDGQPFFWLGDTAWELIHRLTLEEACGYLDDRASKGFTVFQTVVIGELDGMTVPNAYGELPFKDGRPNEKYFAYVDSVLCEARKRGLVTALLPCWGCYWCEGSANRIFDESNAAEYGRFLGARYRDADLIWVLGGDRPALTDGEKNTVRELARGLSEGDGGAHLKTFHPIGPSDSSDFFEGESWLDFNMCQSSHAARDHFNGEFIRRNFAKTPVKPALDGEARYEDMPVGFYNNGMDPAVRFDDSDCRQAAYFAMFSGACGHTYGNNNIWQMYVPGRAPKIHAGTPWQEALHHPGARQMGYMRKLLEDNGFTDLVCGDDYVFDAPKMGGERVMALIAQDRSRMLVYSPYGRQFGADCTWAGSRRLKQTWFNCKYGSYYALHTSRVGSLQTFVPPTSGRGSDWVLVLEAE